MRFASAVLRCRPRLAGQRDRHEKVRSRGQRKLPGQRIEAMGAPVNDGKARGIRYARPHSIERAQG